MKGIIVRSRGINHTVFLDDCDFYRFDNPISLVWPGGKPYATLTYEGVKNQLLHRIITNAKKGETVDHKNGNSLDNTRSNLRICTQAENCRNQKRKITNTSGYKGVSIFKAYAKYNKQFVAEITVNYKRISLGYFGTPEEAALAYNKAALEHHGEFAKLNELPCVGS